MHHLAEELSDLPASPPSTIDMNSRLQSSLLRWRSEDRGKEQWKGVVDVLRVRTQVNQCTLLVFTAVLWTCFLRVFSCAKCFPNEPSSSKVLLRSRYEGIACCSTEFFPGRFFLSYRVQLRRSLAYRPRAKSLGNRPAESALPHGYNSE